MKCNTLKKNVDQTHIKNKEIQVESIIQKITRLDELFKGSYILDPYQYCYFRCKYCDSSTTDTIFVKQNALRLLADQLPMIKQKRVIIGSIHDPYQPIEEKTRLTRTIITYLLQQDYPIHILTKSPLVHRDLDIFVKNKDKIIITISAISNDSNVLQDFEPNLPSYLSRLKSIKVFNDQQITAGLALIPLLPGFIENYLENMIQLAYEYQVGYVLYEHLFLKGNQKIGFFSFLEQHYPKLLPMYQNLFKDTIYPNLSYRKNINRKIMDVCRRYNLPTTLPK
jgi:DNA repair photolyase